ncbi:hypothetical protein CPB84DRAFT_968469 [Gymnopilus junonius]|uniref:Protein kinase domain-containing protein n=1 Tax=Gymnopilus junonius TaxID=109634 RepID=A0A9P5TNN7_GYMJU|nr:hypothetical protein CPB84DRAFT_968469 [Gymnopilus junonius]
MMATKRGVRNTLPKGLQEWRDLCNIPDKDDDNVITKAYEFAWNSLRPLLEKHGMRLWNIGWGVQLKGNKEFPIVDNYYFINASKREDLVHVDQFCIQNGLSHAASASDKRDFILRIITAGGQGHDHLRILKRLSSSPDIFRGTNHVLPMVDQIIFEDITIGLFPRLSCNIQEIGFPYRQTSIEDILYIVLQALEGIAYIHSIRIAHRDLFASNIMIEWCPESIKEGRAITRPRVYLIDFETAVEFPEDLAESDLLCVGIPIEKEFYARKLPDEVKEDAPYNPFLLDIWQFGFDLKEYCPMMDIPEVSRLWDDLNSPLAQDRPSALEALQRLESYVKSVPPAVLHVPYIKPVYDTDNDVIAVIHENLDDET